MACVAKWRGVRLAAVSVVAFPCVTRGQGGSDSAARIAPPPGIEAPTATAPGSQGAPLVSAADSLAADSTVPYVESMSIGDVVANALRVSPTMAQAAGSLRIGQSGERVAYGEFIPQLSLNSSIYQSNQQSLALVLPTTTALGPVIGYPAQSYTAGLAASFDIFTGGRRTADITAARANTRSADANLLEQRYAVALDAKQAFYAERRAHELVQVSAAAVATAERAVQYAEARMRRGTATRADVLLAQLNAATARQALIAARDTLTTNAYALGRLVGIGGAVAGQGADTLPNVALAMSDSAIVAFAVRSGPGVRAADEAARASDAVVRSTETQYVPDIKITGGYDWANNSAAYSAARPGWVVEIGTSYPLFNGFVREDNVTRASADAHTARVTATDEHRFARAEAERLLASVRFAWQNIAESEEAVRVSAEDLRVVSVRYQNGVATFLDLSTAQVDNQQAGVALITARYDYQIARATLEALIGRDL
jgi:outer membrane protein